MFHSYEEKKIALKCTPQYWMFLFKNEGRLSGCDWKTPSGEKYKLDKTLSLLR